jgi:Domain of unknown function (DUF5666)
MDEGSDIGRQRVNPLVLVAIAVAAATIGVVAVLVVGGPASPSSVPASYAPSASGAPSGGGSDDGGQQALLPPLTGSGNGLQMMLDGRVTAVSATSVTIGGQGPSVTAKITRATRFSGKVHSISGVKVGDRVSASLSGSSATTLTATTIEDPGEAP